MLNNSIKDYAEFWEKYDLETNLKNNTLSISKKYSGIAISKALTYAYMVNLSTKYPNCLINGCCVGLIATDMNSGYKGDKSKFKTVKEGCITPIYLAIE